MASIELQTGKCASLITKWRQKYGEERYCCLPAGWGTDHPGTGRCKLHGGRCTGPKSSFAYISKQFLKEKEKELLAEYNALSEEEKLNLEPAIAIAYFMLARCVDAGEQGMNQAPAYMGKLAQLVKTQHERKHGQQIKIKVEIINLIIHKIVQTFNEINAIDSPDERRKRFAERLSHLSFPELSSLN